MSIRMCITLGHTSYHGGKTTVKSVIPGVKILPHPSDKSSRKKHLRNKWLSYLDFEKVSSLNRNTFIDFLYVVRRTVLRRSVWRYLIETGIVVQSDPATLYNTFSQFSFSWGRSRPVVWYPISDVTFMTWSWFWVFRRIIFLSYMS